MDKFQLTAVKTIPALEEDESALPGFIIIQNKREETNIRTRRGMKFARTCVSRPLCGDGIFG